MHVFAFVGMRRLQARICNLPDKHLPGAVMRSGGYQDSTWHVLEKLHRLPYNCPAHSLTGLQTLLAVASCEGLVDSITRLKRARSG